MPAASPLRSLAGRLATPVLAAGGALMASPLVAQEGAREQIDRYLGMFGLSCAEIVFFFLAMLVVAWMSLFAGTRMAGLPGGVGKALGVLFLQGVFSGLAGVVAAFMPIPKEGLPAILATQGVNLLVGTFVVHWLYATDWKRALFTASTASAFSLIGLGVLIFLIF